MNSLEGEAQNDGGDDKGEQSLAQSATSSIISRMALNDNKAGMHGLNREKINRIIHENSVGSKFYENEKKKDAQVDARICKLLQQVQMITPEQMYIALGQTNAIIKELESSRDLSKTIVHIDMDAFYASVEERDNPGLKNKPMAVGGMEMLCTSNYVARRYGVRAAMPGFIGKKLCPDLILVPLNFSKYTEVSNQVRKVLSSYDSNFMPMGLDEAYLDLTQFLEDRKSVPEIERTFLGLCDQDDCSIQESKIVFGLSAEEVVREMRFKIERDTRLTASAGIAPNTLLAKVASDMNKPNGQYFLEPSRDKVMEFISKLPIRKVPGIGKVTEKLLNATGIKSCQDLHEQRAVLYTVFSETMSSYFLRISIGIGATTLENDSERKSISTERTYGDISNPEEMYQKCEELCETLEADAKKAGVKGLTVTLKIKTTSFELHTKSKTLFHPVNCKSEVYPIIADLLRQELAMKNGCLTLRLIGVGLSKLTRSGREEQHKFLDYFIQKGSITKRNMKKVPRSTPENEKDLPKNMDIKLETYASSANEEKNKIERDCFDKDFVNFEEPTTSAFSGCGNKLKLLMSPAKSYLPGDDWLLSCPICFSEYSDLSALNMHIDNCASPTEQNDSQAKQSASLGLKLSDSGVNNNSLSNELTGLTCPICNGTFCCQDVTLEKFNRHVDCCLNRKTIMKLVKSESKSYHSERPTANKRNGSTSGPPKKRQKKLERPSCTLDRFFK